MHYLIENEKLAAAVAGAPVQAKHRGLLGAVRRVEGFEHMELTAVRDEGSWLDRRRVIDAGGQVVAEDHKAYLQAQVQQDGGNVRATWLRLRDKDLQLTTIHIERLYLVRDRGGPQEAFDQVEVWLQREVADQQLMDAQFPPADLDQLMEGQGYRLAAEIPVGMPHYHLHRAVDVAAFVALGGEVEGKRLRAQRVRMESLVCTDARTGEILPLDLPAPTEAAMTWKGRRLFQDWTLSSAGRSGARICRHWALQISDWTSPEGERHISLIPMWATAKPPAVVESRKLGDYELYGRLLKIDERMGAPFAWYFFGLHGNRVSSESLRRVLQAAESGLIVMPEHDYQVLRRWGEAEYGF